MDLRNVGFKLLIATVLLLVVNRFMSLPGNIVLALSSFGFIGSMILISIGRFGPME